MQILSCRYFRDSCQSLLTSIYIVNHNLQRRFRLFFPELKFLMCTKHMFSQSLQMKISVERCDSQFARERWLCSSLICGCAISSSRPFQRKFLESVWTAVVTTTATNLLWLLRCIIAPPLWTRGNPSPAPGRERKCCRSLHSSPPQRDEYWVRMWDETQDSPSLLLLLLRHGACQPASPLQLSDQLGLWTDWAS